ncbi:hypothetical protein AB0M32_28115 [Streptomyces sp. NPDC051985]|uniref:hypothetical protein n=1 Tax=Streptomyces sp. NPDC051985 TaxID=3155807 RepID=UPI003434323B
MRSSVQHAHQKPRRGLDRPLKFAADVLAHWVFAGTGLSAAETWLAASLEPTPGTEGEPTRG